MVIVGGGFQGAEAALRLSNLSAVSIIILRGRRLFMTGPEVKYDQMVLPRSRRYPAAPPVATTGRYAV